MNNDEYDMFADYEKPTKRKFEDFYKCVTIVLLGLIAAFFIIIPIEVFLCQ